MAKGIGLIGNFRGKVGNTVGYKLTASNNGQTQGIRVYQPIVKNPKSAGQAEQRAKLLAVNATYRALKMVIDRGNEGLPYGNKSRLAWLKGALKSTQMPWIEKGMPVTAPVGCQLTKGSLNALKINFNDELMDMQVNGITSETDISTVGKLATALIAADPTFHKGDQLTFVLIGQLNGSLITQVNSVVLDTASTDAVSFLTADENKIGVNNEIGAMAGTIILSREGANGEHLRSTQSLVIDATKVAAAPYDADSKAAAIASYRASAATNSDWQEDAIQ